MKYLTSKELSTLWNVSQRRIILLAKEGRIIGATRIGKNWVFPENVQKPIDGRTSNAKTSIRTPDFFRFPTFEFKSADNFNPPLSDEELKIKYISEAFHSCDFVKANELLNLYLTDIKTNYLRFYAIYAGCMIDIYNCNFRDFFSKFSTLTIALQKDFPHKEELKQCIHQIEACLGFNKYYETEFIVDQSYSYHSSFLPRLLSLSTMPMSFYSSKPIITDLNIYETCCMLLENTDDVLDLQSMHIYLSIAYASLELKNEITSHLIKALDIAQKYDSLYNICLYYNSMRKLFEPAMSTFPKDFKVKIENLSNSVYDKYVKFINLASFNTIYKILPTKDYQLVFYAIQGYTNKEIAKLLHVSEITIGKRYSELYSLANVKNKNELIELYNRSVNQSIAK